jgi:hypothetical protein
MTLSPRPSIPRAERIGKLPRDSVLTEQTPGCGPVGFKGHAKRKSRYGSGSASAPSSPGAGEGVRISICINDWLGLDTTHQNKEQKQ